MKCCEVFRPGTPYESFPWRPYAYWHAPIGLWNVVTLPLRVFLTMGTFLSVSVVARVYCILRKRTRRFDRAFDFFAMWSSRLTLRIFGFRVEVIDESSKDDDDDDDGPTVVVANHVAVYDGFAVMAATGAVSFVARSSFFKVPVVGSILRALEVVGVDRRRGEEARKAIHVALRNPAKRWPLAAFPEGATTNGQGLIIFKTGVFEGVDRVKPVFLRYGCRSNFDLSYTANQMDSKAVLCHFLRTLMEPGKVIEIKLLPVMARLPDESDRHFADRVRRTIAGNNSILWDTWDNARLRQAWFDEQKASAID